MAKPAPAFAVTLDRDPLFNALGRVQAVVPRRNTMPILGNVLLEAEDEGALNLTGTDLDVQARDRVRARVEAEGALTVPAALLHDLLRGLPEGAEVSLRRDAGHLVLTSGRSRYKLPVLPAGDFPQFDTLANARTGRFTRDRLKGLIARTSPFMSAEESRFMMCGVYLHGEGEAQLRAVATNTAALACVEEAAPEGLQALPGVIVPRDTVAQVERLAGAGGDDVEVAVGETLVRFASGDFELTSKIIDAAFPPYQRVIPAPSDTPMTLKTAALVAALKRAMVVSTDKTREVRLAFEPGRLIITARNMETGEAVEELEATYEGAGGTYGFNAGLLLQVLGVVQAPDVEIHHAGGKDDPFLFVDPAAADVRLVLMSLKS